MADISVLLERGFLELEDGEWEKADGFFEEVLNIDPKESRAYLGKLMAEKKVCKIEKLVSLSEPIGENNNYKRSVRFADEEFKEELEGYEATIRERLENERKEALYQEAVNYIKEKKYHTAVSVLEKLGKYKDTQRLIIECNSAINDIAKEKTYSIACEKLENAEIKAEVEEAVKMFASVINWKDAKAKIDECRKRAEELPEEKEIVDEELEVKEYEDEGDATEESFYKVNARHTIIAIAVAVGILFLIIIMAIFAKLADNEKDYRRAQEYLNLGKYTEAVQIFEKLNQYKDSPEMVTEARYQRAISNMVPENVLMAYDEFSRLGTYKSSKELLEDTKQMVYDEAVEKYRNQYFEAAESYFGYLDDFQDTEKYMVLIDARNYDIESYEELIPILNFEDTCEVIKDDMYFKDFLLGEWRNYSGDYIEYYINENDGGDVWCRYNIPTTEGKYYRLDNGDHYKGDDDTGYKIQWTYTVIDGNTVKVYCYKNQKTYTLVRQ